MAERRGCLRWLGLGLVWGCAACSATREALRELPGGQRVVDEFDRYKRMADQLRRNFASGPLDEKDLLAVLRRSGTTSAPRPAPAAPPPARPAPAPAPRPTTPAPRPAPEPPSPAGYRWPLEAGLVSSEFGQRRGGPHAGIDIAADPGVPVYTVAPGEVAYAGDKLGGYGNVVIVRHDRAVTTVYGHNSALRVKTGDKVRNEQVIALLGSTGRSTGPHLHFEFRDGEQSVNPRDRLPPSRF